MVIRCVVPGCRNTSSKGFLLKRFPRDAKRRELWYANIPKENWEPTDNTYVCEIHFEEHHWEKNRVDRLKSSAAPTIFRHRCNYVRRRKRTLQKCVSQTVNKSDKQQFEMVDNQSHSNSDSIHNMDTTMRGSKTLLIDEKDLLVAQLQEQVAKQRECISHYETIVQLMNYKLMKLKKVLKAHHLLDELD